MKKIRIAVVQNNASPNISKNLLKVEALTQKALTQRPDLIAFPETFCYRGSSKKFGKFATEEAPRILRQFKQKAKESQVAFLLGSLIEASRTKQKFYNTSYFISEQGKLIGKYRKIHLFDNQIRGAAVCESNDHLSGSKATVVSWKGIKWGMSVCYDLRFPELYRLMSKRGAQVFFIPANFTEKTGISHWETLLRARAIENQAFVVAPGQVGRHAGTKILSYGASLLIDAWGTVLKRAPRRQEGVIFSDLDLSHQMRLRRQFPVLKHRKL